MEKFEGKTKPQSADQDDRTYPAPETVPWMGMPQDDRMPQEMPRGGTMMPGQGMPQGGMMMPGWGMPRESMMPPMQGMYPPYGMNPWMGMPQSDMMPGTYPMYGMPGYPSVYLDEMENERDMQKLKELYPEMAKDIMTEVEEECDKMEYDGSMMFDEYPDRVMLGRVKAAIYDRVKDKYPVDESDDRDEAMAMQQEMRRRYPPRKNWLGDLIEVMLYQEMYRRRCRRRNCRRRY